MSKGYPGRESGLGLGTQEEKPRSFGGARSQGLGSWLR